MQNTKTKRIIVIALVVISLFILATQSYANGVTGGAAGGGSMPGSEGGASGFEEIVPGDNTGDANSYGKVGNGNGDVGGNGIVGDDPVGREGTLGDETASGDTAVDTVADDGGTNWVAIIVAIVIAVALIAVVVALIPKKRMD